MVQVMIRLPDGQTMPVQFPVMASAPTAMTVPAPVANTVPVANAVPVATAIPVNSSTPTQVPGVRTSVPGATSIITPATQLIQTVTSSDSQVPTTTSVTKMNVVYLNQLGPAPFGYAIVQITENRIRSMKYMKLDTKRILKIITCGKRM
ncbi:hypothetical protein TNCV_3869501 [Trichonephila clavipes]|nr:hypothetical protein TNCV_3869501 [Trichonephila clavipes]